MVELALLQRKCLALTMLSPGMHCRPPPSGRVAAPGSEAKFGRPSFGPSDASGDPLAPLLFRKRRNREKEKVEWRSVLVCPCKLSLYRYECENVCVFSFWEENLKGMQLFLYTCPPPLGSHRACWKQTRTHDTHTHTHTQAHTERLWNGWKYQTTPAEYLSRQRSKAAH